MRPSRGGTGVACAAALVVVGTLAACGGSEQPVRTTSGGTVLAAFVGEVDAASGQMTVTPLPEIASGALTFVGVEQGIPVVQDGIWANASESVEMLTTSTRTRAEGCYEDFATSFEAEIVIRNGFAATDLRNVFVEITQLPSTGYESCLSAAPVAYPEPARGWLIEPGFGRAQNGLFAYPDLARSGGQGTGTWSFRLPTGANFKFYGIVWAEKVDRAAPVTTASLAGGSYTGPQQLTLTCADTDGCADTFYRINGGAQTPYTGPIHLSGLSQQVCYWSVDLRGNEEPPTQCRTYDVTMPGTTASYDASLHAPHCAVLGSACDTGASLVAGRDSVTGRVESHAPNTLDFCVDGTFDGGESLDRLSIATTDGGPLQPGKSVAVTATVTAAADNDYLDVFTATATSGAIGWTYQTRVQVAAGQYTSQTITTPSFVLPPGAVAIRGRFGRDSLQGTGVSCGTLPTDDHDDLVFATDVPARGSTAPTGVAVTAPVAGADLGKQVLITASASDDVAVTSVEFQWQNYVGGVAQGWTSLGTDPAPPWAWAWNTVLENFADSTVDLRVIATDNAGNTTTSAPVQVQVYDRTPPIVAWVSPAANAMHSVATPIWTLTATATDNVVVGGVDFYVDGVSVCTGVDTGNPNEYACDWDTTDSTGTPPYPFLTAAAPGAPHAVFARAYDYGPNGGNTSDTPIIYLYLTP